MKRAILTAGLLFAALAASAKGADTILDKDPVGIYVTIVSVVTVLSALIVLFLLIQLFAKVMVKSAQKKAAKSKTRGILVDDMKVSVLRQRGQRRDHRRHRAGREAQQGRDARP